MTAVTVMRKAHYLGIKYENPFHDLEVSGSNVYISICSQKVIFQFK